MPKNDRARDASGDSALIEAGKIPETDHGLTKNHENKTHLDWFDEAGHYEPGSENADRRNAIGIIEQTLHGDANPA